MLHLLLLGAQPLVQLEVTAVLSFQHTQGELRQSRLQTLRVGGQVNRPRLMSDQAEGAGHCVLQQRGWKMPPVF